VPIRLRALLAALLTVTVAGLATAACGGGGHSYKAGTPAATGQAPSDCSIAPADVVGQILKRELTGPIGQPRGGGGITCTYNQAKSGAGAADQIQLNSNADKDSMAQLINGLKQAHNPVKKIKGWGDEAYASTVYFYSNINNFAVRKGKVSVFIISTADYKEIRALMKDILAKL
jgi:hypothetical protein